METTDKVLKIKLASGKIKKFNLIKVIDSGTQGDILLVKDEYGNKYCAKYYHQASTKQYKIAKLLATTNIHPAFTLPAYLSALVNNKYLELMQYYNQDEYQKIGCYINNACDDNGQKMFVVNQKHTIYIVKQLLEAFGAIHKLKLVYGDISSSNILISRKTYQIKIIDTVNFLPEGYADQYRIYGTGFYRSPEAMRKESYVDINSERHSLYVLIFQLMVNCHPLLGKTAYSQLKKDLHNQVNYLGHNPIFIFEHRHEVVHPDYQNKFNNLKDTIQNFFYLCFSQECLMKKQLRPIEQKLLELL